MPVRSYFKVMPLIASWVRVAWPRAGSQRNQLVVPSNHPRMVRTRSLRTQSARRRVDHRTICGRSCADSGHYKALSACINRIFVDPNSSGRRPENFGARTDANNQIAAYMARAAPSRRGWVETEPARFGSYGKPIGGWGCFRVYRSPSVFGSCLGSCDRVTSYPPLPIIFWTR
jgi:hypothetical protein